ncbi:hypothetical protein C8R43DRAFT_1078980 [Mycena crocata]|nr:hypothetical protein C8R43DRAFT_1078980 [Mycena crocata]
MPTRPPLNQIRSNKIITYFTEAVNTLEVLAQAFNIPSLGPIIKTSQALLVSVQTIGQNRDDCAQLMEKTCSLLYVIVSIHVKSTTGPELQTSMLNHLEKFTETLHRIYTYMEAQQGTSRIQKFFRQGEMSSLLKGCNTGLQEALEVFHVQNLDLLADTADMQNYAEDRHQEVLQLIEELSESTGSDRASSRVFSTFHNSSTSISMLPSEPKIFHGRESELSEILNLFKTDTPRIAILGPGGIGKTSLARALLHHPQITERFEQHRFFVVCDSASTKAEFVSLIAAHLQLKQGKDLNRHVIQFFVGNGSCLLILDDFETLWEPVETREEIEEFLSLLTDIPHLALIVRLH